MPSEPRRLWGGARPSNCGDDLWPDTPNREGENLPSSGEVSSEGSAAPNRDAHGRGFVESSSSDVFASPRIVEQLTAAACFSFLKNTCLPMPSSGARGPSWQPWVPVLKRNGGAGNARDMVTAVRLSEGGTAIDKSGICFSSNFSVNYPELVSKWLSANGPPPKDKG